MKIQIILIFLLLFLTNKIFSQEIKYTKKSDTIYWKKYTGNVIKDINFKQFEKTQDNCVFRRWDTKSLLEIIKNGNEVFAKVTFIVYENWENDSRADVFCYTYIIDKKSSNELCELFNNYVTNEIPSDKYIENWKKGFHGIEYIYEFKKDNKISFKQYWTPKAQKNLKEAEYIVDFNKKVDILCDYKSLNKDFLNKIPFMSYSFYGSGYTSIKGFTKKELRNYKKQRLKKKKSL